MVDTNESRHEFHNGKKYEIVSENNRDYIELNGFKYPSGMTDLQVKFHEEYKPVLSDIVMGSISAVSLGAGSVFGYMGLENMINNSVESADVLLVGCALGLLYGSFNSFKQIGKTFRK